MKRYTMNELDTALQPVRTKLREIPGFTGVYLVDTQESGAVVVVQLDPMTEAAQQQARELLSEFPTQFRKVAIATRY